MRVLNSRVWLVGCVGFSADGARVLAATGMHYDDRFAKGNRGLDTWALAGGDDPEGRMFDTLAVAGFVVSPIDRRLYAGMSDGYLTPDLPYVAVDPDDGTQTPLGLTPSYGFDLGASPDGRVLIGYGDKVGGPANQIGQQARWDPRPGGPPAEVWNLPMPRSSWAVGHAIDPGRDRFITREGKTGLVSEQVYELSVRSLATAELVAKYPIPGRTVDELALSPDGAWLVVRAGRNLFVWDADDLACKPRKVANDSRLHFLAVAFHPSGEYLAATDNDATVKLYDTASWQVAKTYTWNVGRLRSIAFSPDGLLAAAGSDTGKVVVWDVDL